MQWVNNVSILDLGLTVARFGRHRGPVRVGPLISRKVALHVGHMVLQAEKTRLEQLFEQLSTLQ